MNILIDRGLKSLTVVSTTLVSYLFTDTSTWILPAKTTMTIVGALVGFLIVVFWHLGSCIFSLKSKLSLDLRNERKEKLKKWRSYLGGLKSNLELLKSTEYSEMRPFLSDPTIGCIERNELNHKSSLPHENMVIGWILEDLSKLEQKWNLI